MVSDSHSHFQTPSHLSCASSSIDYNIASKISGFTSLRDEQTKTQYAYAICDKTEYVMDLNLNGYIIWEISGDLMPDFSTPLLDAANNRLNKPNIHCGSVGSTAANEPIPLPPPQPSLVTGQEPTIPTAPVSTPNLNWPRSVENEPAQFSKPTPSPTAKAITPQAAEFASLFYPDFKKDGTQVGCQHDGNAPKWITNDMMRSSRVDCCSFYFSPALSGRCNRTHPYYPNFENQSCINDGNHPSWMVGDYLADSKWACCRNVFREKKMLQKCTNTPQ